MEEIKSGCRGEVRRIHIVYFLCRDGKIDQPHLVRVHHLSRHGVHLRDVKRWLSELRGEDMPECFAWSYKRRYRGGFVWQDLTDDDLITAISDNEYVLKGSFIQDRESPIKEKSKERERESKITPEAQQKEDGMLSFEKMSSKDSLLRKSTSWQKENTREEELKGLEKTVKKERKLVTDLSSDCGGGRKAANVMRNCIIGCKTAETKGSVLKEVRQEAGSLSEGSDGINCNKDASSSKTKEKQTTTEV